MSWLVTRNRVCTLLGDLLVSFGLKFSPSRLLMLCASGMRCLTTLRLLVYLARVRLCRLRLRLMSLKR